MGFPDRTRARRKLRRVRSGQRHARELIRFGTTRAKRAIRLRPPGFIVIFDATDSYFEFVVFGPIPDNNGEFLVYEEHLAFPRGDGITRRYRQRRRSAGLNLDLG
jgi:hypothetical protein